MHKAVVALSLGVVVIGGFLMLGATGAHGRETVEIRWLIAHQPVDLFAPAARIFEETFNARSEDLVIRVRLLSPADIAGANVPHLDQSAVYAALNERKADIATIPVAALGSTTPASLVGLPFLFPDLTSAGAVLDGDIGTRLLASLAETGAVRGLAFTLSGGYQLLATKGNELRSMSDLEGMRVATPNGALAADTLRALGATPIRVPPGDTLQLLATIEDGTADAVEITYTRLSIVNSPPALVLNETSHSVFFTVILTGNAFYDSLSPKNAEALSAAALAAARLERRDSISLADATRRKLQDGGSTVVTIPTMMRDALREKTRSVFDAHTAAFGADFLASLRD